MGALRVLGHASRLWWKEWIGLILLNILWVLLQVPLVTGPPATAVLYAIARKVYDDEVWELPDLWGDLRRLFWPAWRWALPNLLLGGILIWNFYAFQAVQGGVWSALRLAWATLLLLWFMLNLFYWPFWLAQEEKSVRLAYANSGRFLLRYGWTALFLALVGGLVLTVSVWTAVPLSAGAVCWLALVGETAVRRSLVAT
jgi:uncharacterized membrane protein YesL